MYILRAIAMCLFLTILVACGTKEGTELYSDLRASEKVVGLVPKPLILEKEITPLKYILEWDWKGAQWDAAANSYTWTTDRGYKVWLESGHIGNYSVQLIPCVEEEQVSRTTGLRRLFDELMNLS